MTFASPSHLLLLALVPLVAVAYALLDRARRARARVWSRPDMLPNVVRDPRRRWRLASAIALVIGLSVFVVGVARPQVVRGGSSVTPPTVVLAFDVSSSMGARDVQPNRLAVARSIALRFLREVPANYRVGVVSFANRPSVTLAPTLDRSEVVARLPRAPRRRAGTAIGDAVTEAVALAAGNVPGAGGISLSRPGAVLLFSDGGQNAGGATPEQAATSALIDYVPVDTVAIGTPHATVPQTTRVAGFQATVDIPVPVDASTLSTLSKQTNGRFFKARALERSPDALSAVYRSLQSTAVQQRAPDELGSLFAAGGIVCVMVAAAISGFLFGGVP